MKQRLKSYKFWVALSGAVVIFVKALGQAFGFEISADVIDGVIMGFCGVLVAMGLVEKPTKSLAEDDAQNPFQNSNVDNKNEIFDDGAEFDNAAENNEHKSKQTKSQTQNPE